MPGRRRSSSQRVASVAALLAVTVAAGACTGERPDLANEDEATTTSTTEASTTTTVEERTAQVAEARGEAIDVFADASSTEPVTQLTATAVTSAPGIPIVFLVKSGAHDPKGGKGSKADDDDRVEVYLPTEPPGSTGWVATDDVSLSAVTHRIEVEVATHRLRVYEGDELVLDEPAGIGPDRPDGRAGTYLRELVQPPEDDGFYGAYAYGLSGSPLVRAGLEEGGAVVGIHGTDRPALVGTDMPRGSIAVADDVLTRLVREVGLPLGTPVELIG